MNDVIDFNVIDEHGPQSYRGTFEVPAAELERVELSGGSATITIEANADKGDVRGEYIVDGNASVHADLSCSRCLEPTPFAQSSTFHVRFRPRLEASEENEEIEISDAEDLDVEFYAERAIPLRDLAVEQIQLSIPMKPLCDESCLGLCPNCGAVKSREACSCEATVMDERWGALQSIRNEIAKKKDV